MSETAPIDEPRFVLLDIGRSDVIRSIADPAKHEMDAEERAEAEALLAAARALSDEDVKWIADNIEEHGGAGILFDSIGFMMPDPDQELSDFCRNADFDGQNISFEDAEALMHSLYKDRGGYLGTYQIERIGFRSRNPRREREERFPVYELTREQLLDTISWFGDEIRDLFIDASDEELHRFCAINNVSIHEGDDTGSDIFSTLEARIKVRPELASLSQPTPAAEPEGSEPGPEIS
jgi:hypothetical protein